MAHNIKAIDFDELLMTPEQRNSKQERLDRLMELAEGNKVLEDMKKRFRDRKATKEDLAEVLDALEGYFATTKFPSLNLYVGKYAGEILEYAFDNYPEIFVKEKYDNLARRAYYKMLADMYEVTLERIKCGEMRQGQVLEFIKYIEPILSGKKDADLADIAKIEMVIQQ